MKRAVLFTFTLLLTLFLVMPAFAQTNTSVEDLVPADFAGFVHIRIDDNTPDSLNLAYFAGQFLQPGRIAYDQFTGYDELINLDDVIDIEGASFVNAVLPWLGDEMVIAYRSFDERMEVAREDTLMIFPTYEPFYAASYLSAINQGQDIPETEEYRGTTLFINDKSTFAITTDAVLIGGAESVRAVLDRMTGEGESITALPGFAEVLAASPADPLVYFYLQGAQTSQALSALVSGDDTAQPMIAALGETIRAFRGQNSFEAALLGGELNGAAVALDVDLETLEIRASLTLDTTESAATTTAFDASVLEFIPRSAMLVQSGPDAPGAIYDLLSALPLVNFAGRALSAFPINESPGSASGELELPTAEQMQSAAFAFLGTLDAVAGFNVERDLLDHLAGSYTVALLPNPNNPTPVLNMPFDLVIAIKTTDGATALDGAEQFIKTLFDLSQLETQLFNDVEFRTVEVAVTGEAVLRVGLVGDTLLIATGSAAQLAMDAMQGDNRLIDNPRWATVQAVSPPQLYMDIVVLYNLFYPVAGQNRDFQVRQLGARAQQMNDGIYQLNMVITLPPE